jgi:hypothetical protein
MMQTPIVVHSYKFHFYSLELHSFHHDEKNNTKYAQREGGGGEILYKNGIHSLMDHKVRGRKFKTMTRGEWQTRSLEEQRN